MAIEVTDVVESQPDAPAPAPEELPAEQEQTAPREQSSHAAPLREQSSHVAAPRGRGRPAGLKDKQPRKRPVMEESEEEEPPPRPVTRRSRPPNSAPRRRVQIVEEESDSPEEAPPPSPRTRRHQEWTAYRQQKASAYQANVNRYAVLLDRMLAEEKIKTWQRPPNGTASERVLRLPNPARASTT